jgi:hypothetical protein
MSAACFNYIQLLTSDEVDLLILGNVNSPNRPIKINVVGIYIHQIFKYEMVWKYL